MEIGGPLDVAGVGHGDRHVLVGDQVLDAQLALGVEDLRPPFVTVAIAHGRQFRPHQLHQELVARQDRPQPLDQLQDLGQLVDDLLALEAGQPLQLHVENGLRLHLRQLELGHQAFARFGRILRSPNQLDHLVQVIERDLQALEDVRAGFGLAQLELGAAPPPRAGTRRSSR